MKRKTLPAMFAAMLLGTASTAAKDWDFEDAAAGKTPAGWTAAKTGTGPGSVWQILEDATAPKGPKVVAQVSSEGPKPLFNLCVAEGTNYTDLDVRVSLKAIKGKIDQGGGLVWRYQDANNYYVARVNPLEANFRLYKVINGKRIQIASADVEAPARKWLTVRIVHRGQQIQCFLNGEKEIEAKDDALPAAGKIGFWTKADAVTSFDALSVAEAAK